MSAVGTLQLYTEVCMSFRCIQVQKAFNAKHVISVCSSLDSSRATEALQRLLENADTIMGMVDLAGAPFFLNRSAPDVTERSRQRCECILFSTVSLCLF